MKQFIQIFGACEHNLKNIDVAIPRDALVVITGLSGSGKSSLAFDTIYAEGQRRYLETFSTYARQFIGTLQRPQVEAIEGLSPCIAIEQKTISKNPRSTVGTMTEIYDYLRLLFARIGVAYSYETGKKMIGYTQEELIDLIYEKYSGQKIYVLAPLIQSRKGHYKELFQSMAKKGFTKVRVDGKLEDIEKGMQLNRYQVHDIELVIDVLTVQKSSQKRLGESIQIALKQGEGVVMVLSYTNKEITYFSEHLMCAKTGKAYPNPEPNTFSFNSPKGGCPDCNGLGFIQEINLQMIMPDKQKSIIQGGIAPMGSHRKTWLYNKIQTLADSFNFTLKTPIGQIPAKALKIILYGGVIQNERFEGIVPFIIHCYKDIESGAATKRWAKQYLHSKVCKTCKGYRLQKASLHFRIRDKHIGQLARMDVKKLLLWFKRLEKQLPPEQILIAKEILKEIQTRINFLLDVGLAYLTLDRISKTLSGGEAQRIRLATQIGSKLVGVLYILDEPSIGLHQRDNQRLIRALCHLRDLGNSVLVVEHDRDMIAQADCIIDMGPAAGKDGGEIISTGTFGELSQKNTLTSLYMSGKKTIPVPTKRREGNKKKLTLKKASGHNLKNITVSFPLGKMICVTGVSGSGKSSLINGTLYPILNQHFYKAVKKPLPYSSIEGLGHIDKVIAIDQLPIGRTPRSNPATYTGIFTEIRTLFAQSPEAVVRGYKAGRFSFNVKGGRCENCQGKGVQIIEMNFLPDVQILCEECQGKRFNRATLEVRYKGKSIADVLYMSIEQAIIFFENIPKIYRKLKTLQEVGLGYITLGQAATTLSGGEAQRIKLSTELCRRSTGNTFYILDEPTTGLHFEDIRVLMQVLNTLTNQGNTVLIVEHNMDVIKLADWIIDIGKEGGQQGGEILFTGTPENLIKLSKNQSYTADCLKRSLHKMD